MKKLLLFSAALALAAVSCTKEFVETAPAEDNGCTIFSGSFDNTKIALGEKDGTVYKALWEAGDALSVIDASTEASLGTATLTAGAGTNIGTFSLSSTLAEGTKAKLVYAGGALAADQTRASTSKALVTSGISEEVTVGASGQANGFTLTHSAAIVRISVGAASALDGATLNAVIIRSEGANLNASDGDYVRIALSDTPVLSSEAKEIVFTAKAADLTGSEVDIAFELTKSGDSFTLPVAFNGGKLEANKVNSFNIPALAESMCAKWYQPHDKRLMVGEAYAYGEANCYFIQCKNGSTYTGATYTPNANIPDNVDIDFKARGDFLKVSNPTTASFVWMRIGETDPATGTGTGAIYTMRTSGYKATGIDPTKFTIGTPNTTNCTVNVRNDAAFAGAPILLMVKNGTVLWAWSLWNIAADGTTLKDLAVRYTDNAKILNLDMGQATDQFATWAANDVYSEYGNSGPGVVHRTIFRYQWGRPIPLHWNSAATLSIPGADCANVGNIPAIVGPVSLKESLKHPCAFIVGSATTTNVQIDDWIDVADKTLWGNGPDEETDYNTVGAKSIYDPCPKGYRVPDRKILNALKYNSTWTNVTEPGYHSFHGVNSGDATVTYDMILPGYYISKTATSSSKFALNSMGGAVSGLCCYGTWWSNHIGKGQTYPGVFNTGNGFKGFSSKTTDCNPGMADNNSSSGKKANGYSVRCQKDTDNR